MCRPSSQLHNAIRSRRVTSAAGVHAADVGDTNSNMLCMHADIPYADEPKAQSGSGIPHDLHSLLRGLGTLGGRVLHEGVLVRKHHVGVA